MEMQRKPSLLFFQLIFVMSLNSCNAEATKAHVSSESDNALSISDYQDSFLADGFDYPFGDRNGGGTYMHNGKTYSGWYIATHTAEVYSLGIHTGEDWNGVGGGNTDKGQPVFSTAAGKVLAAKNYGSPWGNVVLIEHRYIENGHLNTVYSLYAHLDSLYTNEGRVVKRGQKIGTIGDGDGAYPAHLHFELRKAEMKDYAATYWPSSNGKTVEWVKQHYYNPSNFIKAHRQCDVPLKKEYLLVAIKHEYKMYLLKKGRIEKTWDIALSQEPIGHKAKQGDNKLPEGAYSIIQKSKGPFAGDYADYFGPVWMRINYPNSYDAERGHQAGLISKQEMEKIKLADSKNQEPPKNTRLGGGIGIHGWINEWPKNNRHLTWGCISMKNSDLPSFYELIPVGTEIFIIP